MRLRTLVLSLAASTLALAACDGVTSESGTLTLLPSSLATLEDEDFGDDFLCGLETRPNPPATIDTSDLAEGEVGAGFRNWHRREQLCGRRHSWVWQGAVAFDAQPVRDLGLVGVRRATLRMTKRPPATHAEHSDRFGVSDGLVTNDHCARVRIARAGWTAGFQSVENRDAFVAATDFAGPGSFTLFGPVPSDTMEIDVTELVRQPASRFPEGYRFVFETTSDLLYRDNNEFCMHVLGGFELEIEFDRLTRSDALTAPER